MKNLLLAPVVMLVFMFQSFFIGQAYADSAQLDAINKKLDAESNAFFVEQGKERAEFMKQHHDIIEKQDRHAKADREGRHHQKELTPQDESTFQAFVQKQAAEKQAFFAKFYQERNALLSTVTK